MAVLFDSVELKDPERFERDWGVQINETKLYSGKTAVQSSAQTRLAVAFKCFTETYTDISNLKAKIGSPYTLAIDGTNYTKCYINSFAEREWFTGKYEYDVSFVQDTS